MNKNKLVFANWKMNLNSNKVRLLVEGILSKLKPQDSVDVVLAPPLPYLGNDWSFGEKTIFIRNK